MYYQYDGDVPYPSIVITESYTSGSAGAEKMEKYYYNEYGQLSEQRNYISETTYSETQYSYTNNAWVRQVKTTGVTDAEGYLVTGAPGYSAGTIVQSTTYNTRGWPLATTDANRNTTTYLYIR